MVRTIEAENLDIEERYHKLCNQLEAMGVDCQNLNLPNFRKIPIEFYEYEEYQDYQVPIFILS